MQAGLVDIAILVVICGLALGWDRWKKSATRTEFAAEQRHRSGLDQVLCTSCGNRNAEKAKVGTRVASGVLGGLVFSRKARAQFHCLTCNRYW